MSRSHDRQHSPSLAQHFEAPDDYVGHFGWVCGYSADASFLDNAAERFTRLTAAHRAQQGRIALSVLLDPGNPCITVPGVMHFPMLGGEAPPPFRLLHAKVAVLGFQHVQDSTRWRLRLIVSTGNWTRQTLEESLDLAWCLEVDSAALAQGDARTGQACADMQAAYGLLQWLQPFFDTRLLRSAALPEAQKSQAIFAHWQAQCAQHAQGKPRFFDSRSGALLAQLVAQIQAVGRSVARNYLAMGSGFYEAQNEPTQAGLPRVPGAIIDTLKKAALLTQRAEVDLFVNPQGCQAIAMAATALQQQGVVVRPAAQPRSVFGDTAQPRTLHAKFLFAANYRERSNTCSSAWVYLGSGNLTHPGFLQPMSASGGNLEAGVVLAPQGLMWEAEKGCEPGQVVTNVLPIQWQEDFSERAHQLQPGAGVEPRAHTYIAAPVAWLNWWEGEHGNELRLPDRQAEAPVPSPAACDFVVLDTAGQACPQTATGFQWPDAQPRQVRCRWSVLGQVHAIDVPVVDRFGRIAATPLPAIGVDEALWQLAAFPLQPVVDDSAEDTDDRDGLESRGDSAAPPPAGSASYPIRRMMGLVESIAAKQTAIAEPDWDMWCLRLKQTLDQAKTSAEVRAFQALGVNPLSPLWHAAFRPVFAENRTSQAGKAYEEALQWVEQAWDVEQLTAIGGGT